MTYPIGNPSKIEPWSPPAPQMRSQMGDLFSHEADRFYTINPQHIAQSYRNAQDPRLVPGGLRSSPYKRWLWSVLAPGINPDGTTNMDALTQSLQQVVASGMFNEGNTFFQDLATQNVRENPELKRLYEDSYAWRPPENYQGEGFSTRTWNLGPDSSIPAFNNIGWGTADVGKWNLLQHLNQYFGGDNTRWEEILNAPANPPTLQPETDTPPPFTPSPEDIETTEEVDRPTSPERLDGWPVGSVRNDHRGRPWIVHIRENGTLRWLPHGWEGWQENSQPTWPENDTQTPPAPPGAQQGGAPMPGVGQAPGLTSLTGSPENFDTAGLGPAPMPQMSAPQMPRQSGMTQAVPRAPGLGSMGVPRGTSTMAPSGMTRPTMPKMPSMAPRAPGLRRY